MIKRSHIFNLNTSTLFIRSSLIALWVGILFGCLGGLQYIFPEFLSESIPFYKIRPIHVTLVISWIFMAAIGGIYSYLPQIPPAKQISERLGKTHFLLFSGSLLIILSCYAAGIFGGREYFEFPPILSLPLAFAWILFMYNFFRRIQTISKPWPIYIWMWTTGVCFFLFTFIEQYLWLIPYFQNNVIRDITIQWKSLGAIVGSWNMLVYGTAFYVMEQLSGDRTLAKSKTVFFFYFLGLTNLMFNWGHHTYIVPAKPWIKEISYLISMTELIILGKIIWDWKKTVQGARKLIHRFSFKLLIASDIWIFLNLTLAILMSIPSINKYTHGTHITVAHAMGTTIGINTMILLASLYYIVFESVGELPNKLTRFFKSGFLITQISLLIFWTSLILSGITKAMHSDFNSSSNFYYVMQKMSPFFHGFSISGFGLLIGITLLLYPLWNGLKQARK